jgi:hypothetical protein
MMLRPTAAQRLRTGQSAIRAKARHPRKDALSALHIVGKKTLGILPRRWGGTRVAAGGKVTCDGGCGLSSQGLRFC